jgi:hypothetical protein
MQGWIRSTKTEANTLFCDALDIECTVASIKSQPDLQNVWYGSTEEPRKVQKYMTVEVQPYSKSEKSVED